MPASKHPKDIQKNTIEGLLRLASPEKYLTPYKAEQIQDSLKIEDLFPFLHQSNPMFLPFCRMLSNRLVAPFNKAKCLR
jgi:hypothetical protein